MVLCRSLGPLASRGPLRDEQVACQSPYTFPRSARHPPDLTRHPKERIGAHYEIGMNGTLAEWVERSAGERL
jgi:hypothetical protein